MFKELSAISWTLTKIGMCIGGAVLIGGVITILFFEKFNTGGRRSKVGRVRSDHRSLATAIETYYIDQNEYPAMANIAKETLDYEFYGRKKPTVVGRTFRAKHTTELITLTTPIAYITSNFPDVFADTAGKGFLYYTDGRGWILGSYGPDADEKTGGSLMWDRGDLMIGTKTDEGHTTPVLAIDGIEAVYFSNIAQPSDWLKTGSGPNGAFTYDPTNGTYSPGDVWRVKQ